MVKEKCISFIMDFMFMKELRIQIYLNNIMIRIIVRIGYYYGNNLYKLYYI